MQLYYSPTSPYARKVRAVAMETGQAAEIEVVPCDPFDGGSPLHATNPLGRVPALSRPDADTLFDSPVICEYLIARASRDDLLPAAGEARWTVLRWQALADGLLDSAFTRTMEMRKPTEKQSEDWLERWARQIGTACDALEAEIGRLPEPINLAHIAIACALGYLDLRHGDLNWRDGRPGLTAWEAEMAKRPSIAETKPEA